MKSRIVNLTVSIDMEMQIDLAKLHMKIPRTLYEPDQFPAVTLRVNKPKCVFLVFSTGKVVLTGVKSEKSVRLALRTLKKILKKVDCFYTEDDESGKKEK